MKKASRKKRFLLQRLLKQEPSLFCKFLRKKGLCVSIVPKHITFHMHAGMYPGETLDSISILELSADIQIYANICFRKTEVLRPGAATFLEFIRQKKRKSEP